MEEFVSNSVRLRHRGKEKRALDYRKTPIEKMLPVEMERTGALPDRPG